MAGLVVRLKARLTRCLWDVWGATRRVALEQSGQGTTEYAILVGILVLMAIVAVVAFRDNLQKLWDAIVDGMNSL